MSVIFVLVGQCGNQLGEEILSQLFEGTGFGKDASPFFTRDGKARCVLVDSEPKAIEGVLARSEERFGRVMSPAATSSYNPLADGGIFRRDAVATGESGRGNCWGLGYNGLQERIPAREEAFKQAKNQRTRDDYLLQRALCAVHAECCRADDKGIEAIIVVHSLAGGTGSGFTSKLVEKLDLHFQKRTCPTIGSNEDGGGPIRGRTAAAGGGAASARSRVSGAGPTRAPIRCKYEEADEADEAAKHRANPHLAGKTVSEAEYSFYAALEDKCRDADGLDAVYGNRKRAGCILSISVCPMKIGENAVQGINGVLTLHSLLRSAHAVILLRNDDALHHMPQPLTIPQQQSTSSSATSASTAPQRATLRSVAASATSGTAFHAPQSMHEVNAVFASQIAVVLQFGTVFGAVGDLLRRVCPLNPSTQAIADTGNREAGGWSKIISLVPLPQRAFARFGHCAYLSAIYRLPTDMFGAHLATDFGAGYLSGAAVVPLEQIHRQCRPPQTRDRNATRPTLPDAATSDVRVVVPKAVFQNIYDKNITRPFQAWPVMVLNQLDELNESVLFPLLADAHGKLSERAFIHTFEATGVEVEYIETCLRRVAHHLCGEWDMGMGAEGRTAAIGMRPPAALR